MAFKMKNPSIAKLAKEAGNNRVSPMKAKKKFKVSTSDRDFLTDEQRKVVDQRIDKQLATDVDRGPGIKADRAANAKKDSKVLPSLNYDPQKGEFYSSGSSGSVNVKIKGKKGDAGLTSSPSTAGSNIKDVKKVKLSKGKGKSKITTKVKYDKQGNVKKVSNRRGRLGLRKGTGVSVGEGKGRMAGKEAAEAVVKQQGVNVRGRKRKAGETKDKLA
tara:strand:+ start:133 stop:780 length:648 start_codon:yes stop_codon:yes gene_type:complete